MYAPTVRVLLTSAWVVDLFKLKRERTTFWRFPWMEAWDKLNVGELLEPEYMLVRDMMVFAVEEAWRTVSFG